MDVLFAINTLKIDKSFVRDMLSDKSTAEIIDAIVDMGHCLNLKVIAEEVENVEQLAFLQGQGCDEAQGYLLGSPMPVSEMAQLLLGGMNPDYR